MKYLRLTFLSVLTFILILSTGCNDETINKPDDNNPKILSAGDMTVFLESSLAFKEPAPNISNLNLHLDGDQIYETGRVSYGSLYPGLGPVYNNFSCNGCHQSNGRTTPTLWTSGGSGPGYSVFLMFLNKANGEPIPGYGGVLHDQNIFGATPEGRVSVTYTYEQGTFADGDTYELAKPVYSVTDWITGSEPSDMLTSFRIPLRHIGLGLMLAVPDATIIDIASKQVSESGGFITGKPNYVTDRNGMLRIGHIDHKAESIDLTVEISFNSDIGATNNMFPVETYADQNPNVPDSILHHSADISDEDMNAVDYYLHTLGVPARRNVNDLTVLKGEQLFKSAGCVTCHRTDIRTTTEMVKTIGGTNVPEVVNQLIHPYTDFLLHDMGPDLADGRPVGNASGSEWRTTPLWGIGLQYLVNGHSYFMHDGRARDFTEAIMWHGGESSASREYFRNLSRDERNAVIKFLQSL
jgi:CxxC motif-containing protein (DUF1111 family)